jgi:hypothetical protein
MAEFEAMNSLVTHFHAEKLAYTGEELRPHFLLRKFGLKGSTVAAFRGPAIVQTEHLVDWEDRIVNDRIEAKEMVHFLGEFFGAGLREGVFFQRLFMSGLGELLNERLRAQESPDFLVRRGDDLFVRDKKLSVSIVTASPVSVLLHAGINVDSTGAPVAAIGLAELGFNSEQISEWARCALTQFAGEWSDVDWACAKVRPVV